MRQNKCNLILHPFFFLCPDLALFGMRLFQVSEMIQRSRWKFLILMILDSGASVPSPLQLRFAVPGVSRSQPYMSAKISHGTAPLHGTTYIWILGA
jgi:hypothetical protein